MLPTYDERQKQEIRQVQRLLATNNKENSSFTKVKK